MYRIIFIVALFTCVLNGTTAVVSAQPVDRHLFANDSVYHLHVSNPAFRRCDQNRDGALQVDELQCYDALQEPRGHVNGSTDAAPSLAAAAMPAPQYLAKPAGAAPATLDDPLAASTQTFLLVRQSKDSIGSFADPTPHAEAAGAEFAWSNDRIDNNEVWSARGIVAASLVHYGKVQRDTPYIDTMTIAPYVLFDRTSNTTKIADDIDNLAYGGVFELGVANVMGATHFIDIGGQYLTSFGGDAKNWSVGFQWQPVGGVNPEGGNKMFSYFGTPLPLGRYFVFSVSPTLHADYVGEVSDAALQPIFAERNEAFRTGPGVFLTVDGIKLDYVPWWIRRIHYQIGYGWLYDWISNRDYELLDTALTLNLDEAGHLGLTLSYRKGQLVETGQDVDLTNIALAVSF